MNIITVTLIATFMSLFNYITHMFSVKYRNYQLKLHIAREINKSLNAVLKELMARCYPLQYGITVNWVYENQTICSGTVVISQN